VAAREGIEVLHALPEQAAPALELLRGNLLTLYAECLTALDEPAAGPLAEAVEAFRRGDTGEPGVRLRLAQALLRQADYQAAGNNLAAAVATAHEAAAMYRELAPLPGAHIGLAWALLGIGTCLVALGSPQEAVPHLREAAAAYADLSRTDPSLLPGQADAERQLGLCLHGLQDPESLIHLQAATDLLRSASASEPVLIADLVVALADLSSGLLDLGQPTQALDRISEAVTLQRHLVQQNPEDFTAFLVEMLEQQAATLHSLQRHGDATHAEREAQQLRLTVQGTEQWS
jgi:tetratricopeptide (TPR) repeat protein